MTLFIINILVGAGAAGCVVANRLSEHFHVLLLEAGGNPPPQTKVPAFTNFITSVSSIHFEYTSVPQINASLSTEGVSNQSQFAVHITYKNRKIDSRRFDEGQGK